MTKGPQPPQRDVFRDLRRCLFEGFPKQHDEIVNGKSVDQIERHLNSAESSHLKWLLWRALHDRGRHPNAQQASHVLGVVCEFTIERAIVLIVGFRSGDASLYLSTGGGVIGGVGHQNVREAAAALCACAEKLVKGLPPQTVAPPSPDVGDIVFSVLTPEGILVIREAQSDVQGLSHRLHDLYLAMHELISALRMADPDDPQARRRNELAYVNCLFDTAC